MDGRAKPGHDTQGKIFGNKSPPRSIHSATATQQERPMSDFTSDDGRDRGVSRRRVLECMTWAGTGVLWTIAGGVPRSVGIMGEAMAAEPAGLNFLQISDSHVG